ncbi:unnamed protein product, partial [Mesorhabditis belari]|uniref:SID1 transmembrane family member 1 n=1 Tax=Mesorhabditis belari TaxID=2138241 RepID=A0AAF3F292_9BILA
MLLLLSFLWIYPIFAQLPNCYENAKLNDTAWVIPFTIQKNGFKCQGEMLNQPVIFVGSARESLELVKIEVKVSEEKGNLQVIASNGRDTQVFALPDGNANLIDGRVLQPLLDEDFNAEKAPNISIILMARPGFSTKFHLDVHRIARPQYNIELSNKSPLSLQWSFKALTPSNYMEHRVVVVEKKPTSLIRILVNSSDEVCMRVMLLEESTALMHNSLLAKHDQQIGSFTKKFSLDYKPKNDEPLILRYLVDENDEHCATKWDSPKKRSKKIEISYQLIDETPFSRPIAALFGFSIFLMILPILPVAGQQLVRYLTKTREPQEMINREEAIPMESIDADDALIEWRIIQRNNDDNANLQLLELNSADQIGLNEEPEYALIRDETDGNRSSNRIPLENFQFAFFLMPIIVQIAISYFQQPTPSLDHCFHNFGCAKKWGNIESFNHVISNAPYAFAGFFYLSFVKIHSKWRQGQDSQSPMGVFQNVHLEWSMGLALICEAIASGVYHLCPSKSTYKFDTPFIVIVCVLGWVKLYGSRHGTPSNTKAHLFVAIALFVDFCVSQLAEHQWTWPFQAIVLVISLLFGLFKVYTGKHFLERPIRPDFFRRLTINYQGRILLFVASINVLLAVIYFFFHTYLHANKLVVFFVVLNLFFYLGYYLLNKRHSKEKLSKITKISLLMAVICWTFALFAFTREESDWTLSPAKSRELNSQCIMLDFFDYHDLWHFLSALASVFSLISISTIDDSTSAIPRERLHVF